MAVEASGDRLSKSTSLRPTKTLQRYALLKASEIAFRNGMVANLSTGGKQAESAARGQGLAQMVFCIDVRSERIRRRLEATSDRD